MAPELVGLVRCGAGDCQRDILDVYRVPDTGKFVVAAHGNGAHASTDGVITGAGTKGTVRVLRPRSGGIVRALRPRGGAERMKRSFGYLDVDLLPGAEILVDCKRHGARMVRGEALRTMILESDRRHPGQMIAIDVPASRGGPPPRQSTVLPSN